MSETDIQKKLIEIAEKLKITVEYLINHLQDDEEFPLSPQLGAFYKPAIFLIIP